MAQMAVSSPKIFGIGLNKTGTTTLGLCGQILGLRCTSSDKELTEDVVLRNDFSRVWEVVDRFDLFEDWPWPLIYKELDRFFPGSKFILTTRLDEWKWLESLKKHSMRTHPTHHLRKLAYGFHYPHRHQEAHLDRYRRHNEEVRSYFKDRAEDFLEVCWERGDGFPQLCNFLRLPIPEVPMPHANRGADQRSSYLRWFSNSICRIFRR
jgi:hypothetical protein